MTAAPAARTGELVRTLVDPALREQAAAARAELRGLNLPDDVHDELAEMASFSTERDYQ
jgi:hypothetical protein